MNQPETEVTLKHTGESKRFFVYEPEDQELAVGKLYLSRSLFAGPVPPDTIDLSIPPA